MSHFPGDQMLDALQKANGLVNKAMLALLKGASPLASTTVPVEGTTTQRTPTSVKDKGAAVATPLSYLRKLAASTMVKKYRFRRNPPKMSVLTYAQDLDGESTSRHIC